MLTIKMSIVFLIIMMFFGSLGDPKEVIYHGSYVMSIEVTSIDESASSKISAKIIIRAEIPAIDENLYIPLPFRLDLNKNIIIAQEGNSSVFLGASSLTDNLSVLLIIPGSSNNVIEITLSNVELPLQESIIKSYHKTLDLQFLAAQNKVLQKHSVNIFLALKSVSIKELEIDNSEPSGSITGNQKEYVVNFDKSAPVDLIYYLPRQRENTILLLLSLVLSLLMAALGGVQISVPFNRILWSMISCVILMAVLVLGPLFLSSSIESLLKVDAIIIVIAIYGVVIGFLIGVFIRCALTMQQRTLSRVIQGGDLVDLSYSIGESHLQSARKEERFIESQIAQKTRRLNILEIKSAATGINTSPEIIIEIEDIKNSIDLLRNRLQELRTK